jgi:hypothetical protein
MGVRHYVLFPQRHVFIKGKKQGKKHNDYFMKSRDDGRMSKENVESSAVHSSAQLSLI